MQDGLLAEARLEHQEPAQNRRYSHNIDCVVVDSEQIQCVLPGGRVPAHYRQMVHHYDAQADEYREPNRQEAQRRGLDEVSAEERYGTPREAEPDIRVDHLRVLSGIRDCGETLHDHERQERYVPSCCHVSPDPYAE